VSEDDIWSAVEKFIYDSPMPGYDNKHLLLGFDVNSNLLEVVYNVIDEHTVSVFHVMTPCAIAHSQSFLSANGP
jgi:hypothetical protein